MAKPEAIRPVSAEGSYVRFLIHGEPGVGKSVLAGTSPNALLLLNDEDEASSAAIQGSKAEKWVVPDFAALSEAYEYLRHGGHKDFEWVWIDNSTLLQDQMMDEVMQELVAAKDHRSLYHPDKPQYGEVQMKLGMTIRLMKALPMNVGITCHTERIVDQDDNVKYLPMLQGGNGKFSQKICGYMGAVGYLAVVRKGGKAKRVLYLDKRGRFYAKDRYDITPNGQMEDPTIPKLMEGAKKNLPNLGSKPVRRAPRKAGTSTRRTSTKRTPTQRSK